MKGVNDLETWCIQNDRLDLLDEWNYEKNDNLTPSDVTKSQGKKVWWKCKKYGHEWESVIYARTGKNKTGCPYCAGKKVLKGFNDLATIYPDIAFEYDTAKNSQSPVEIHIGSNKKVWWKCSKCNHEWNTTVISRTYSGCGCPKCGQKKQATTLKKRVMNIDTGIIYDSITEAIKQTGIANISACCKGKAKTAGGYHWKYAKLEDVE